MFSTKRLISEFKEAAYLSAFICIFFIMIEVPIVLLYISTRYLVTLIITFCVSLLLKAAIKLIFSNKESNQ